MRDCEFKISAASAYASEYAISFLVTAVGCEVTTGNFTITGNTIDSRDTGSASGFRDGIRWGGDAKDGGGVNMPHSSTHLRGNLVAGCRSHGMSVLAQVDSTSSANIQSWDIAHNVIRNNGESGILFDFGDGVNISYLRCHTNSNIVFGNQYGIHIRDKGDVGVGGGQIELVNDTIVDNFGYGIRLDSGVSGSLALRAVVNTIVRFNNGGEGFAQWGGSDGYDPAVDTLYFYNNDWGGNPTTANGNIDADPMFVDMGIHDYHLKGVGIVISPCIDSGTNTPPGQESLEQTDFEGDRRKIDGDTDSAVTVDMGADEYKP